MFTALRVLLSDTPVLLLSISTGRKRVVVRNLADVRIYLGGVTVTADDGFPLDPGETFRTSTVSPEDPLYAVTQGHEAEVAVLYV